MNEEHKKSGLCKVIKLNDLLINQKIDKGKTPHATILNVDPSGIDINKTHKSECGSDVSANQKSPASSPEKWPTKKDL